MSKVALSGYILVPATDLEAVLAELPNHIALTREEEGCLRFEVSQDQNDMQRFAVYEEFSTREAFQIHQARVAASRWGDITVNVERHYTVEDADDIS